jgi:hypothetical protein
MGGTFTIGKSLTATCQVDAASPPSLIGLNIFTTEGKMLLSVLAPTLAVRPSQSNRVSPAKTSPKTVAPNEPPVKARLIILNVPFTNA